MGVAPKTAMVRTTITFAMLDQMGQVRSLLASTQRVLLMDWLLDIIGVPNMKLWRFEAIWGGFLAQ